KRHVYDKITTEIGPQYLLLTLEDYERLGPYGRVYPPIASKRDTERCWKA
ncbi:MAG: dihydroorotase, partial [Nitrososphaeria archaeon]|nr:dihydroorotase [Nitrososphaeria archaeon]